MLFLIGSAQVRHACNLRLEQVHRAVWTSLVEVGMQGKVLADAMGFGQQPSHLSRQLREHGVNLNRLLNAGKDFWRAFLPKLADMAGLTREDVIDAFGLDGASSAEREAEQKRQRDEIEELKRGQDELRRQLERLVRQLPSEPESPANREGVA